MRADELANRPNHEELLSFYGHRKVAFEDADLTVLVEEVVHHLLDKIGIGEDDSGIIVVRCGPRGCCVGTKGRGLKWFPAYFEASFRSAIKDVTGGEMLLDFARGDPVG